jgi:hypothetical protein
MYMVLGGAVNYIVEIAENKSRNEGWGPECPVDFVQEGKTKDSDKAKPM